jgi:hypothetical protein
LTVFHAIGFTIDFAHGLYSCYIVGDAIGHAIRYIIDYTNDKAIECAIDYAIGNVNGQ